MSLILPGLYLGSQGNAKNASFREENKITHILTIEMKQLPEFFVKDCTYKYVYALDMHDQNLLPYVEECVSFIDEARTNGGTVLVHCLAGVSRSATIVLAYLMKIMKMTLAEAMTHVTKFRDIRPNSGFVWQLGLFERMGCTVDQDNEQYKAYKLKELAYRIQKGMTIHEACSSPIADDPLNVSSPGAIYKCRKCRRPLFKGGAILSHYEGKGQEAFWEHHSKQAKKTQTNDPTVSQDIEKTDKQETDSSDPGDAESSHKALNDAKTETEVSEQAADIVTNDIEKLCIGGAKDKTELDEGSEGGGAGSGDDHRLCNKSLFIEPIQWMDEHLCNVEGKLLCPKCSAKIGSFKWTGERCPCGTWITPAFHISPGKVDKTQSRKCVP